MNELRMKRLCRESEELAVKVKYLRRLSRDDKRLEGLLTLAEEYLLIARLRANENLEKEETREKVETH
jgi:hypothetical protein